MSTTRSRAKGKTVLTTTDTTRNNEFDAAMHIGELSAKISQLQVTVTATDDRRDTSEAETKQTVTEMRFELRCLQERYAKLLNAIREQRRDHIETTKQLASLQQMSDKLTVLRVDRRLHDAPRARGTSCPGHVLVPWAHSPIWSRQHPIFVSLIQIASYKRYVGPDGNFRKFLRK